MILRFRLLLLTLATTAVLSGGAFTAAAQTQEPDSHPACKVVREYLSMILTRQYNKSADIMDEKALASLQADYVDRVKHAPTMDDEEAMIKRLGKATVDEVAKMKPREFYTAYNVGLQREHEVPEDVLAIVRKTLSFKVLSVGQEDERTVHVLVRTKHSNGKVIFESLDLISLVKNGDKWQIAPNQQAPKVTPIDENGNPVKGAVDPVRKPSADPVKKPAGDPVKPAAPPKTNGPKRKPNP